MHKLSEHFRPAGIMLALALLSAIVYLNALQNGYAVDDVPIIRLNPVIQDLANLREILLGAYWPGSNELYRPLALLSFALDWAIFGDRPAMFHLVNIVFHVIATLLVFTLIRRLGAGEFASCAGAAVFAVHPVHVEAVANIVGRSEILATIFVLIACIMYLRGSPPLTWFRTLAISLCYLLALGAKEIAVSLPGILILLEMYRHGDASFRGRLATIRRQVRLHIGMATALGTFLVLRWTAIREFGGNAPASYLDTLTTSERLSTAVRLWPEFARLLFWPQNLAWDWGPGVITPVSWREPIVYAGLLLGAAVLGIAISAWKSHRWFSLGIVWFAVTAFVISQIPFAIGVMLAERHLYLPSVAVSLIVPGLAALLQQRQPQLATRLIMTVGLAVILVLGGIRTWNRNMIWYSTHTAYVSLGYENPASYRAYWYAGRLLEDEGRSDDALQMLRRAAELAGGRYYVLNIELADALLRAGLHQEADAVLRRSLGVVPHAARAYLFLGRSLIEQDRFGDAIDVLHQGRRVAADSQRYRMAFAHHLALAFDGQGALDSALAWRWEGINGDSGRPLFEEWLHLARVQSLLGERELASAALDSARTLAPDTLSLELALDVVTELEATRFGGWVATPILSQIQ